MFCIFGSNIFLLTVPTKHLQHEDSDVEPRQYGKHTQGKEWDLDGQQTGSDVLSQILGRPRRRWRSPGKLAWDQQVLHHGVHCVS